VEIKVEEMWIGSWRLY